MKTKLMLLIAMTMTLTCCGPAGLAAPTNLVVTQKNDLRALEIKWTSNATAEVYGQIEVSMTYEGKDLVIPMTWKNGDTWQNSWTVAKVTNLRFRASECLKGSKPARCSNYTGVADVSIGTLSLLAPTNVAGTEVTPASGSTSRKARVTWTDNSYGETALEVLACDTPTQCGSVYQSGTVEWVYTPEFIMDRLPRNTTMWISIRTIYGETGSPNRYSDWSTPKRFATSP